MNGAERTGSHRHPLALPLWGVFLCCAVIAWQSIEWNAHLKEQNRLLREQERRLGGIDGSLNYIESGARLGWPGYWKSVEGVRQELKLLRESQGKRGPDEKAKP